MVEEVKSLAAKTAGATTELQKQVQDSQSATQDAVAAIERIWNTTRDDRALAGA